MDSENKRVVLNEADRFVDVDNEAESTSFKNEAVWADFTSGTVKYVAVVIDYYVDAIEYIYSTFLGDYTLEISYDYLIYFMCDWSLEVD